jgi:hypothetical protein
MTTRTVRLLAVLLLSLNLAACVPLPHTVHVRPAVTGIVVEDGKPVPGLALFLSGHPGTNRPCTDAGENVPVSPQGGFTWPSVQRSELTESLLNPVADRGQATVLCIRHPEKGVLIGVVMWMKLDTPVSMRLFCDVAHPHQGGAGPHTASSMLGQDQYCEASAAR